MSTFRWNFCRARAVSATSIGPAGRAPAGWVLCLFAALLTSVAMSSSVNAQTRVEDAEFFLLPDPAADMPGSFRLLSVSTAGDQVFGAFTAEGEFTASRFLLVSRDGIQVVARVDDQLVDGAGQSLGRLEGVNTGQFLSNGALLIEARLVIDELVGQDDSGRRTQILRFENEAFQRPPITEFGELLAGILEFRGRTAGSSSRQFWTVFPVSNTRYRLTDGFSVLEEVIAPLSSFVPDADPALGTVTEVFPLAYSATERLVRETITERRVDADNRLFDDVTERLYVEGGGQSRELITAQRVVTRSSDGTQTCTGTTLVGGQGISPTGISGEAFAINDAGQVLASLLSSCSPGASRTIFRFEPDGVRAPLFEDSFLANTALVVHGILASGEVVATAGPAASRGVVLGTPGSSRLLLLANDEIEDTIVGRVIDPVTVAGSAIAIPIETPPGSGASRIAIARLAGNEYTWTADFGGEWGDAENWNPAGVPGQGDETLFDTEATYDVSVGLREGRSSRIERGIVGFQDGVLTLEETLAVGGNSDLILRDVLLSARDISLGHVSKTTSPGEEFSRLTVSGVPGSGSRLSSTASLAIGTAVAAELVIEGAPVDSAEVLIGVTARGDAVVEGAESEWTMGSLGVGGAAGGTLEIGSNGQVASEQAVIGQSATVGTAVGEVILQQVTANTTGFFNWTNRNLLTVGANSPGKLAVLAGAEMVNLGLVQMGTAAHPGTTVPAGTIDVAGVRDTGQSSTLQMGSLLMGMAAGADTRVQVFDGGLAGIVEDLAIGFEEGSSGGVLVHGVRAGARRSRLSVGTSASTKISVGVSGAGSLAVVAGASLDTFDLRIGTNPGSSGRVTVAETAGGFDATLRATLMCVGTLSPSVLGCGSDDPAVEPVPGLLQIAAGGRVEIERGYLVGPLGRIAGSGTLELGADNLGALVQGEIAPGVVVLPPEATPQPAEAGPQPSEARMARGSQPLGRALPGELRLGGPLTFADGAALLIDIDGSDPAAQDRLIVEGELTIEAGARLVLDFSGGAGLRQGDSLVFLQATSIDGSFQVEVLGLEPGFEFELQPGESGLTLLALTDAVPLGGGNGGEPPGEVVFEVGVDQQVRCEAVSCQATRREDGQPDPGADLVVEALSLEVSNADAVRSADITALVHAGEGASPPAAQHFLAAFDEDGTLLFETSALIELPGTQTRIARDTEGLPVVITEAVSEAGLAYSLEARADGLALHEVRDAEDALIARITSRVPGADATVDEDGTLQVRVAAGSARRAVVEMRPDGVLITRFERLDDGQWLLLQRTLDVINDFAPGSEVLIEDGEDGVRFVIDSRVADALVF